MIARNLVAAGVVVALSLAGCIQKPVAPAVTPETTDPYAYSWSTAAGIGLDGGARIEIQAPATECDIQVEIAGRTPDAGVDALFLWITTDGEVLDWVYGSEEGAYLRSGDLDNYQYRRILNAGGVAIGGEVNMSMGEVVYVLAKNLTSWSAPDGRVFPALVIEASCDGPGFTVTYARNAIMLHERNMESGTTVTARGITISRDAAAERHLAGMVDLFAIAEAGENNMEGTLSVKTPDGGLAWEMGSEILYDRGPPGKYRVEIDRTAMPLAGCTGLAFPCSPSTYWWGFIAGFEETDDPDAFFGISEAE